MIILEGKQNFVEKKNRIIFGEKTNKSLIQQEMESLEIRRMNIYSVNVENLNDFLISISKFLLKIINEYIKLKKISMLGYQQIQVDLAFIRNFLYQNIIFNDSKNIIEGFYNEIIHNANFNVSDKERKDFENSLINDIINIEQSNFEKIKP